MNAVEGGCRVNHQLSKVDCAILQLNAQTNCVATPMPAVRASVVPNIVATRIADTDY